MVFREKESLSVVIGYKNDRFIRYIIIISYNPSIFVKRFRND